MESFGLDIDIEHVFSCVNDEFNRKLMWETCRPKMLFNDLTDVGYKGTAFDTISQGWKGVPGCDIGLCAIMCDSVSALNIKQRAGQSLAERGDITTGTTAQS